MSPKELLYVEDALGHEQYFQTKCKETANQIQDATQNFWKVNVLPPPLR